MRKKIATFFVAFLILIFGVVAKPQSVKHFFSGFVLASVDAQSLDFDNQQTYYILPSPGILPDSPLFMFKDMKDDIIEMFSSNFAEKTRLMLLHSDKKLAMARVLFQRGKTKLVVKTLLSSEKKMLKLVELVKNNKTSPKFIERLRLSARLHSEIIKMVKNDDLYIDYVSEFDKLNEMANEVNKSLNTL